jgi:predicted Zn-dependent peptidase
MARVSQSSKNFKKTIFPNGLTLLSERNRDFRSLSIGVWVKAGTRHENSKEAGLSHFLEHMLFKGTDTRSALDIALQVDQVGGEFNAFTSREYTCFHILLLSRDLDLSLDILSDIVLRSTFDAGELERERKVILQEIAMVDESPEELVHDKFFELIYGRHGLGRPILGTESSIRRFKRADTLRFFKKHYRPDQLIISVAGNISHEALKKKIKPLARSRNWNGRGESTVKKPDPAPAIRGGFWWLPRPTEQVHLVWGVEGLPYASKDRLAAFLLNVYLGGGMSSALFQEIREKNGLAYTVYSSLSPFVDSGVFSIYAATGPSQVALCLKLIEECAAKLKNHLLTEEELQVIKDNLKGTILISSDSVETRMSSIAKNEIFLGEYVSVDDVCQLIDKVTPQDLRRVARKLFRDGKRSILAMGPKPSRAQRAKLSGYSVKFLK